jgi:hypothetical protein
VLITDVQKDYLQCAKVEKCWPGWLKPKLADHKIEVLLPKPKKQYPEEEEEENGGEDSMSGTELTDNQIMIIDLADVASVIVTPFQVPVNR